MVVSVLVVFALFVSILVVIVLVVIVLFVSVIVVIVLVVPELVVIVHVYSLSLNWLLSTIFPDIGFVSVCCPY